MPRELSEIMNIGVALGRAVNGLDSHGLGGRQVGEGLMDTLLAAIMEAGRLRGRGHGLGGHAWVDETYSKIWKKIADRFGEEWLPLENDPPSPRRRVQGWPDVIEFGCGAYGCPSPTGVDGVAVKLTQDPSEAYFAAQALAIQPPDPVPGTARGIVNFYNGVFQIPRLRFPNWERRDRAREETSPVFLLWRDIVDMGAIGYFETESGLYYLTPYHSDIYNRLMNTPKKNRRKLLRWAAEIEAGLNPELCPASPSPDPEAHWSAAQAAGDALARRRAAKGRRDYRTAGDAAVFAAAFQCGQVATQYLADTHSTLKYIAEALLQWMNQGLLIVDLHIGNIGVLDDQNILFDAGHVLPLREDRVDMKVEML